VFQSSFKNKNMNYRLKLMLGLYGTSQIIYTQIFKRHKKAWGISKLELTLYPEGTLGKVLGEFYVAHGFEVMPKLENHDVFHLITETGTEIQDEIAMQYLLFGNGKLSLYMFSMIGIGTIMYPEFLAYYLRHFRKGKSMPSFHQKDFSELLDTSLVYLKASIHSGNYLFI
jgi:ubiquinone biosynthesis protein Coq4